MGVASGVTLVVGGGFHGKSTLLDALETGVYNHRPGDGRERVVSHPDTVKVRAEDGRAVTGVDISAFIDGLPLGQDTHAFTTPNASGSTSQAATIVEALESGARVLLVDEDTSATNFMIRDRRMQALVPKEGEPITPFVDRVRELHRDLGVSAVLVLGGSGDYLDVADAVVALRRYEPHDVTVRARDVAAAHPTGRAREAGPPLLRPAPRTLDGSCLDPRRGRRPVHVKVPDLRTLLFGLETVDLAAVEQVVCRGQIRAIGRALALLAAALDGGTRSVPEALDAVEEAVAAGGLDALDDRLPGDLSAFRRHELAAALNRLRALRVV
jgi:predicted ABC-class ATPase